MDEALRFTEGANRLVTRDDMGQWIIEALEASGGRGRIVEVCKHVWQQHKVDLEALGDILYTWQYDVRWAAQKLRDQGKLKSYQH